MADDDGDDIGSQVLIYLAVYLGVAIITLLAFGSVGKYLGVKTFNKFKQLKERLDKQLKESLEETKRTSLQSEQLKPKQSVRFDPRTIGLFASAKWPTFLRGPASMFATLFGFMPCAVITICFTFGSLLAVFEGWSAKEGILYVLTSALGLLHSLESVDSPENTLGRLVDALISVWVMLLAATAMGIVAGLSLVTDMTDSMPSTAGALVRYIFLYITGLIFASSFLSGCLLSAAEGWAVDEGFFYMLSAICGLDEPLLDKVPTTAFGVFLEVLFICVELGFAGAIIGIVGAHPLIQVLLVKIEGDRVDKKFEDAIENVKAVASQYNLSHTTLEKSLELNHVMRTNGLLPDKPTQEELIHIFRKLDADNSGELDTGEIKKAMDSLGCSDAVAKELREKFDINKDGKLSFEEFMQIISVWSSMNGSMITARSEELQTGPSLPSAELPLPGIPQAS